MKEFWMFNYGKWCTQAHKSWVLWEFNTWGCVGGAKRPCRLYFVLPITYLRMWKTIASRPTLGRNDTKSTGCKVFHSSEPSFASTAYSFACSALLAHLLIAELFRKRFSGRWDKCVFFIFDPQHCDSRKKRIGTWVLGHSPFACSVFTCIASSFTSSAAVSFARSLARPLTLKLAGKSSFLYRVIQKKGFFLQTRVPRELGRLALCSEAKNMIFYSDRKNWIFLPILQWFFWQKKFKHDLKNCWPYSQIGHVLNC